MQTSKTDRLRGGKLYNLFVCLICKQSLSKLWEGAGVYRAFREKWCWWHFGNHWAYSMQVQVAEGHKWTQSLFWEHSKKLSFGALNIQWEEGMCYCQTIFWQHSGLQRESAAQMSAASTAGEPRTHNKCHQHVASSGFKEAEKTSYWLVDLNQQGHVRGC